MSRWWRGRARRALPRRAARAGAEKSQQGKQRRRATTAQAATAASEQKVDVLLGRGKMMGSAEHAR